MRTSRRKAVRPFAAARALRRLLGNPDDTQQVFAIVDALKGRQTERGLRQFAATEVGRQVLAERRHLIDTLNDRTTLAALPRGTLGREYHEFLAEENLSAAGLAEVPRDRGEMTPDEQLFANRMRDLHDLFHVITGYGREPMGEVCALAFTYPQMKGRGIGVIAFVGMLKISRDLPGCGVPGAVAEAYRYGRSAARLAAQDWEALMDQPVAALRVRFGLRPPAKYQAALAARLASKVKSIPSRSPRAGEGRGEG